MRVVLVGSTLWALAMALSAGSNLTFDGWKVTIAIITVSLLFAVGAAIAFPLALTVAGLLAGPRGWETRFAAAFVALAVFTIGITATFYALDYRQYYAHWHADAFSLIWAIQLAYTTAGAFVQFAVTGVRLYFPIGFLALILASAWFARRPH